MSGLMHCSKKALALPLSERRPPMCPASVKGAREMSALCAPPSVSLAACRYRPERLDLALADADIPVVHVAGRVAVPRHEPQLLVDLQHALRVVNDTVLV